MDAFYLGLGQVWKSHTQVVLGPQVDRDLSERRLPMADTLQMRPTDLSCEGRRPSLGPVSPAPTLVL